MARSIRKTVIAVICIGLSIVAIEAVLHRLFHGLEYSYLREVAVDSGFLFLFLMPFLYLAFYRKLEYEKRERDLIEGYMDAAAVFMVVLNPDGTVRRINKKGRETLGYSENEAIGRNWFQTVIPEHVREAVSDVFSRIMSGEIDLLRYYENTILTKGGEERLYAWHNKTLQDESGKITGTISSGEDITEKAGYEKRLREANMLFRTTLDSLNEAVFIVDPHTRIIEDCNRGAEAMFGYPREEMKGSDTRFLHASDERFEEFSELKMKDFESDGFYSGEFVMKRKNGEVFPTEHFVSPLMDESGNMLGVVSVVRDITNRKRAERKINENLTRQEAILNNIPDLAWLKDWESRFIAVNSPFGEVCGLRPEDLSGKTDYDIWPRELAERYRADDMEVMKSRRRKAVEEPLVDKDGNRLWIETIKTPIIDESGMVIGTTGIARNITVRKQAEHAISKRLSFEKLIADTSARFLKSANIREALDLALRDFGTLLCSDRTTLQMHDMDKKTFGSATIWCREGVQPIAHRFKDAPLDTFPWFQKELTKRHFIRIDDIAGLPAEAAAERAFLEKSGVRNVILLSISRDIPSGALSIANIEKIGELDEADIKMLLVAAEIIGSAVERNHVEQLINETKQDWENTFNTITDMITIHDKDFRIIRANKSAKEILGLPFLELSRVDCFKVYHGTGCPPEGCPSCASLKTGLPSTSELFEPHLGKFIEIRAIPRLDSENNVIGLIHVVRDITERKRAEEKLRELFGSISKAKREWELTFDHAFELIILVDRDFRIIRCNRRFSEFVGHRIEDLLGGYICDFIPCENEISEKWKDSMAAGTPFERMEIHSKDGRWLSINQFPVHDDKGEFLYSAFMATDITDVKKAEEGLLASENKLNERVAELQKFYDMAVGREVKMKELKREIERLKSELAERRQ